MTNTSKTLTPIMTVRLLKRSARKPPAIENRMKGNEKSAVTSSPVACFWANETFRPRIMNTTRFFRMLSLNAPWNCVTMRLQNPRKPARSAWGAPALELDVGMVSIWHRVWVDPEGLIFDEVPRGINPQIYPKTE